MSVRKGERSNEQAQSLNLAKNLCTYTLQICKNEKIFPKSYRWLLTSHIVAESVSVLTCLKRAMSFKVTKGICSK